MIKCPNKSLPEWKEIERVLPDIKYTVWDKNNGHGINKAPNGEPSILFDELLKHFNNNRDAAIKAKAIIYSDSFTSVAKDINGEPNITEVITQDRVTYNISDFTPISDEDMRTVKEVSDTYSKIQKGLQDRLNSIKRYSSKNPKVWRELQTLIQQLSKAESEQGMLQFIEHIQSSIGDSIEFLNKPIEDINIKQINQLSKDYVGFYKPLLDNIKYLMDTTDIFKSMPDNAEINRLVTTLQTNLDTVNNRFNNVKKRKGYSAISNYLTEQGMPQNMIQDTINWLDDPKHDSSIFMNWFGMATNSNNAIQQSIAKMLNDTKNATDRETFEKGTELVKLVNKAKEKYGNDVQKLLYEKLDDGTYSGNKVMPLNWGQLRKDKKQFMDDLAAKLDIKKDEKDMYDLPQDENIQKKWFDGINDWYGKRAERKYTPEYYSLRNRTLSMHTRDAQMEIQNYIDAIANPITVDNIEYTNLLSEAEYDQLQRLRKQKKLLANKYNLDGTEKTGTDRVIADELTKFNNEVAGNIKYEVDQDAYNRDRAIIAKKYGEGSEQLKLWESRNTKVRYTQAFYDRIAALERDPENADPNGLYQTLRNRRKEIQDLYKDPITNQFDVGALSDQERQSLLLLDQQIADAYTWKEKQKDEFAPKFSDFAEIATTEQYYKDMSAARDAGIDAYNSWFNANHYEDGRGQMHPASYYTVLKPIDELLSKYSEVVPTGKYTKVDATSNWYNSKFDPTGPSIQPNKKYYDNSKAYNAMQGKPEVKALYDALDETMKQANKWISFLQHGNDTKMPQIPARFMQVMNRKDGILDKLKYAIEDFAATKDDDLDFAEEFSTMPNGDPIKVIPTRFITPLKDPNTISTDATASVIHYYNMAANYKNMQSKQDEIELMLDLLRNITIKTKKEIKGPGSTNIYKQSQLLVDRLMYGRNKTIMEGDIFGHKVNYTKMLDITRGFVTKVNLSGNLWSIGTSLFTDATYTTLEAKMGRYYDLDDLNFAKSEFMRQFPNMMANIGNPDPRGRLPYLLQLNQVVKDNQEIYDRLDQSTVIRALNQNFWFAGYTQADYLVKSHNLLATYHNYRFVENEGFMSQKAYIDKFYSTDRKKGKVAFKQLKTTLYDAYIERDNGEVEVNSKYQKYFTEKLLNDVRNKINITSKRIDGTMREVDKAQVHANAIASYLVLHRNFMVSALHDRFKQKQYNLDTQMEEEGYYRGFGRFIKSIFKNRFAVAQILADYDNMKEYEQYAVKRTVNELLLVGASTLVAVTMAALVDGDDDYDMWITQAATYLAMRSAFEFRTMYNPFEFINLFKSPTAAFSWLDNASSFINLINPVGYIGDRTPFTIVNRGVYKGMPVILRNMIKVTPFKSVFEAQDPKSKRNYLQNQLMNF